MSFMQGHSVKFGLVFFAFVVLVGTARAEETKYPPYPRCLGARTSGARRLRTDNA